MAAERLSTRQIREILRQKWALGRSHRAVGGHQGAGLGTVSGVEGRARAAGLDWPQVEALSDEALEIRLMGRRGHPRTIGPCPTARTCTPSGRRPGSRSSCCTWSIWSSTPTATAIPSSASSIGSFAIGLIVGCFALKANAPQAWLLFLTTGVVGGFTTFSAFSLDIAVLYERGRFDLAALYLAASVSLSIAALFVALALVRHFP